MSCRLSASPAEQLNETDSGSEVVSSPAASIFVMRDNPRQFFVRQPLPSTSSAQTASPATSKQAEEAPPEDQPQSSSQTKSAGLGYLRMQDCALPTQQAMCMIYPIQQVSHTHPRVDNWYLLRPHASMAQHSLQMRVQEQVAMLPAKVVRSLQRTVAQAGRPQSHRDQALPATAASLMTR